MSFRDQIMSYVRAEKLDYWIDPDGAELVIYGQTMYGCCCNCEIQALSTYKFNSAGDLIGLRINPE